MTQKSTKEPGRLPYSLIDLWTAQAFSLASSTQASTISDLSQGFPGYWVTDCQEK